MKKKKNIETFVELQIDLIKYQDYLKVAEECRQKYRDSKLFRACLKKKLGKDYKVNFDLMADV